MVVTPEIRVKKSRKLQKNSCQRMHERNNPADTQVIEQRHRGGDPDTGATIPPQPGVKTTVKQAVPLKPTEVWGRADIHLQPVEEPTLENVGARSRLTPWEVHPEAGFWQNL